MRKILFVAAALCLVSVAAAVVFQLIEEVYPCSMCMLQRYTFIGLGLLFTLLGLASGDKRYARHWLVNIAAAIGVVLTGAGLYASWAIYVAQHTGESSCGRDSISALLNDLPWASWFPTIFEVTGLCGDKLPPLMDIPLYVYSAGLSAGALGLIALWVKNRPARVQA